MWRWCALDCKCVTWNINNRTTVFSKMFLKTNYTLQGAIQMYRGGKGTIRALYADVRTTGGINGTTKVGQCTPSVHF